MKIFPAIDLYGGKAVRLVKGDYNRMTVYSDDPVSVSLDFKRLGAEYVHLVDLEGAKEGTTPNFETAVAIKNTSGLFCEIGGGIRSFDTVKKYMSAGLDRVILGTAALQDEELLKRACDEYGERIAVGVDIKDGFVAVKGWLEKSDTDAFSFCEKMQSLGVGTLICTDISKDGNMKGTNLELYHLLSERFSVNITASGGVSSLEDIKRLRRLNLYAAIVGKAYYIGKINLSEAIEVAR